MNDGPHWLDVERESNRRRVKALEDSRDEWRRLYDLAERAVDQLKAQLAADKTTRQANETRIAELERHVATNQGWLSDRNAYIAQLEETNARQLRELADADAEIARLRGTL